VLWLALIWVALIALWGASDDWGLTQTRRRLRQAIAVWHLPGRDQPHD
jgi:hypothetical protein